MTLLEWCRSAKVGEKCRAAGITIECCVGAENSCRDCAFTMRDFGGFDCAELCSGNMRRNGDNVIFRVAETLTVKSEVEVL